MAASFSLKNALRPGAIAASYAYIASCQRPNCSKTNPCHMRAAPLVSSFSTAFFSSGSASRALPLWYSPCASCTSAFAFSTLFFDGPFFCFPPASLLSSSALGADPLACFSDALFFFTNPEMRPCAPVIRYGLTRLFLSQQ